MPDSTTCPYCGEALPSKRAQHHRDNPECHRAWQAKRCREFQKRWRVEHGEEYAVHLYGKDARRQQHCEWQVRYRLAHPAEEHAHSAIRRGVTKAELLKPKEIYERDGWRCGICGKGVDGRLKYPHPMSPSLDHIIPIDPSQGGTHTRDNVRCSHLVCNVRRGNRGGNEQLMLLG